MRTTTSTGLSPAAVTPLRTLDPAEPLDDLGWLDEAIGDARVVAVGENGHYNRENYLLRHRLLRYLVERHGFSAYAMESGFTEGWLTDNWVQGGQSQLGDVMAHGTTSLMGLWTEMRAHLEWMRQHNSTASHSVGFYGIDLSGSNVSLLPGLDAVIAYLSNADSEHEMSPVIRQTAATFSAPSALSAPAALSAYGELALENRDALTAGLADLAARMEARRLDYLQRTTVDAYERALRSLNLTVTIDAMTRSMARGDNQTASSIRDVAIADTVEWILRREGRILLAAHNGHIQRWPVTLMPGMPATTPMGMHLADRLGDDYLVIGATAATGQTLNTAPEFYTGTLFTDMQPPRPGSLDAVMAASHDGPFATDLRTLSSADVRTLRSAARQRFGTFYCEFSPLDAYDVVVHLPRVTPAEPDPDALSHAPRDVQALFNRWQLK